MDQVMSQAIQFINIVQDNWETLGGLAGFGALFAVIIQAVKSKFKLDERVLRFTKNIKISGKGLVNALLIVMTLAATVLETALQLFDVFPNAAVALPAIYLVITQAHRLLVSPLAAKLRTNLETKRQEEQDKQQTIDDANAYRALVAAQKQAAAPAAPTQPRTAAASSDAYDPTMVIQG